MLHDTMYMINFETEKLICENIEGKNQIHLLSGIAHYQNL